VSEDTNEVWLDAGAEGCEATEAAEIVNVDLRRQRRAKAIFDGYKIEDRKTPIDGFYQKIDIAFRRRLIARDRAVQEQVIDAEVGQLCLQGS